MINIKHDIRQGFTPKLRNVKKIATDQQVSISMLVGSILDWLVLIILELLATVAYHFTVRVDGKVLVVTVDQNKTGRVSVVSEGTFHTNVGKI